MPTRVETYLDVLDGWSGGVEPTFHPVQVGDDAPRVTAITYAGLPESGHLLGFTYGLSLTDNPGWRFGRPELCLGVRSSDRAWSMAAAYVASEGAGDCPFSYGNVINLGQPIADDTAMTAFVVFAPIMLDRDDALDVLGAGEGADPADVINLTGLYPIYASEAAYIGEHGLEAFWHRDWDPWDVARPPAV